MDMDFVAKQFKALGDPSRLKIFSYLNHCSCPVHMTHGGDFAQECGPTVGEVCSTVLGADKISSTMSFHIKELREAGLITTEKHGKNVICNVNRDGTKELAHFLRGLTICNCGSEENFIKPL